MIFGYSTTPSISLLNIVLARVGGWGNRGKYAQQGMTEMGAIALSLSRADSTRHRNRVFETKE